MPANQSKGNRVELGQGTTVQFGPLPIEERGAGAMFYKTQFNGYSVKFSPYNEGRIAVATAQNFGIIGNGRQYVLDVTPQGLREVAAFDTVDGLYDCTWCEANENVLASASGDGSVKVWDIAAPPQMNPIRSFEEHGHEVYCVNWNLVNRDCFLSASWDDTIKLWNLQSPGSLRTFAEHRYCCYAVAWCPTNGETFASASGDCTLKLWDIRQPASTLTIRAHEFEVLSCDWNKYEDFTLVTGSVDKTMRVWDIRQPSVPVRIMPGHNYAVRKVICSPHAGNLVASCSYDMTVCFWDIKAPGENVCPSSPYRLGDQSTHQMPPENKAS